MHTRRLPLRAISPLVARTARLVCNAQSASIAQRLPGIDAWQACAHDAGAASFGRFDEPGLLELAHPAGRIFVTFDLAAYPALDIAAWPARGGTAAPADAERALRVAVAGVILEPLLARLSTLGLGDLRVVRLTRDAREIATRADLARIDLSFTLDGRAHAAFVAIDPALLPLLEGLHASQAARAVQAALQSPDALSPGQTTLADCLVPGRIVLGARRLSIETLRALAPGDVLLRSLASTLSPLVTGAAEHAAASAVAAWGTPGLARLHAPVTIDKHTLLIVKEPTMTDKSYPADSGDSLASNQQESPIDIGELDLPVQFEVDTVALPLSQLYALRPGYVLELSTPVAEAQLKLVTHGQTIGYGELVTVGEHLGIRILKMAHGDGPIQ
ncbi:MAG TPA: type III secretion system cytoplasmic ring protein SctQ [Trinickia sp.]|uniref:type III secretion system cytoplasmic ring protein SctQ n=1 Tax=Trinickia sp. TaxID=2571163 RepID=UPI002C9A9EEC|nr:type III secretion system cytoplasmic ring protein SctQ [Trinickia sp.]HVW50647.1 type III secretion system cytoplasmic ring protein SctQ [Trinickia sp.]